MRWYRTVRAARAARRAGDRLTMAVRFVAR